MLGRIELVLGGHRVGHEDRAGAVADLAGEAELDGVSPHRLVDVPDEGEPALLTLDEVTTAFHEFGHALHGMFSNVKYPYFSGTSVPRDFVEYPSQVNEMWALWPEILQHYAKHYQTGAPMPQELLDKVIASSKFNQGFTTTEYLGAAMLDEFDRSPALTFVIGFMVFAIGGTLVLVHCLWTDFLAVIVSLMGWIALAEGLLLMIMPGPLLAFSRRLVGS